MRAWNTVLFVACCVLLPVSSSQGQEDGPSTLATALTSGKASISARYRFEHVADDDQPAPPARATKDANASTLRLRLNYRTGQWSGWSAFGEFDHVFHVLIDDFNPGVASGPDRSEYSKVVDPEGSDLNQLYFDYDPGKSTKVRLGRQRILLDNQRFVGGVGWRQNEQTYDAVTVNTNALARTALSYSYLNQVRRITGPSDPSGKAALDGHLLNAKIGISDGFSITPYYYFLDYKDAAFLGNSTATMGIRFDGSVSAGDAKVSLLGEFAAQSDAGDNPADFDADYLHLRASWAMDNGLSLGVGFESLGTDASNGQAFRTPLATGHAFNGWADQFLGTPGAGLEDLYASVKFKAGAWTVTGVYHDFSSDIGGFDYGEEFDVSAATKLGERYGLLFKGAFFSADAGSPLNKVDTDKFWIMLTASY